MYYCQYFVCLYRRNKSKVILALSSNPEIVQLCENLLSGGFTLMNTRQRKSKESIVEGLHNLIKGTLLSDKKKSEGSLVLWKSAILIKIDKKNSKLKPSKSNSILKQIEVISLEALQKSFFLFLLIKHPAMLLLYVNGIMLM